MTTASTQSLVRTAENAQQLAHDLTRSAMEALKADINELRGHEADLFWETVEHHASEETFTWRRHQNETQAVKDLLIKWLRLHLTIN